ncbi:MAG: UDP-N-acetylglucosamine--N-acetylmuramyl-(pentapeptide) pyrophosphoryl-undecaprenol N-acetylglucosamine transferase [bacterium]|nr:UDP-N-acetylglucosamine--N-acetylmuramyl-(pentapeptide) pyrophosphoryl-undecaprenol N-acetylglucosamine transferase [bacterium]
MTVLFTGGGTLGSVTPLLAVAEELRRVKPRTSFVWIGTMRGPERALVERETIAFIALPAGKLRRYWSWQNLVDPFVIAWAFFRALFVLRRVRPNVVVGAGSYVQVPVMLAARALRIPIVIHQLDVRPTLANTLVARFAASVTTTFPQEEGSRAAAIGTPVRRAILAARNADQREAKRHFGFNGDRPVLLVLGGGTGALAVNERVWGALAELTKQVDIIHVAGRGKMNDTFAEVGGPRYRQCELLTDDLIPAYAAADLVVSRAGIGTIAELGVLGKSTVLIPMPDTHQEDNCIPLERTGAVEVWHERGLKSADVFASRVLALLHDATHRRALGTALAAMFPKNAAAALAAIVERVTIKRKQR